MLKHAHISRRSILPLTLAISLLFAFVPIALVASHAQSPSSHLFGPKQHYLALGDSLAFGFQPNGDYTHGYVNDLFQLFQNEGTKDVTNDGCGGETSTTFIHGGCPSAPSSTFKQLAAAVAYLQANAGKVSPVTLDIGGNDVLRDIDPRTCTVNTGQFTADLATLDSNLTGTILPALLGALTTDQGKVTGSIVMMNYYDPYQNICPNTVSNVQMLDQHLQADVSGFGIIVDVFDAFGGATTPNSNICAYTWICSGYHDFHPTTQGYTVIADTFAAAIPAN